MLARMWEAIDYFLFVYVPPAVLLAAQCFWFARTWRAARSRRSGRAKLVLSTAWGIALAVVLAGIADLLLGIASRLPSPGITTWLPILVGTWLFSSGFGFLLVLFMAAVGRIASVLRALSSRGRVPRESDASAQPDLFRRRLVKGSAYLLGAAPFVGGVYGLAEERLDYKTYRLDIPIPRLPAALDGFRIVQLSDIHMGHYLPVRELRRVVDVANVLRADLVAITGDFISNSIEPLEECIAELARLSAPLGVWGCNGNHEEYVECEAAAAELFQRHGMNLLRQASAQVSCRGEQINLIGVDYQTTRTPWECPEPVLFNAERLVRADMPNILMSHNPNVFPRAAALGIELTLAGHTHGGQVQLEIVDRRLNPARFMTDYTAGLYRRPLRGAGANSDTALLYVNRGIGTIGFPVRIGVPPEITLLTLRIA